MITSSRLAPTPQNKGVDLAMASEFLKMALHVFEPEDLKQRKAFKALMPDLYGLRNKGFSFPQITEFLLEAGFKYQPSTVRIYYNEELITRQDECQRRMNEQILLLAEMRKVTNTTGSNIAAIASTIAAIDERKRLSAAQKVNEIFGLKQEMPLVRSNQTTTPPPSVGVTVSLEQQKVTPSEYGLLNTADIKTKKIIKPSFFNVEDEPDVPDLTSVIKKEPSPLPVSATKKNKAASPPTENRNDTAILRCQPLQAGVKPLTQRANIAATMYEDVPLEHPAIPGLILSLEQRLYGAALEMVNTTTGEIRLETLQEKRFRVFWTTPVPMTPTKTGDNFIQIDESLFEKK